MALDGFDTLARVLAEAVLNGLWQGLALTALVWLALRLRPRAGAATRYGIWWAALTAVLVMPLLHLARTSSDGAWPGSHPAPIHLSPMLPFTLLAGWALGAAVMLGRLAWGYGYVRYLARTATPLEYRWQRRAARLTGSLDTRVCSSRETQVPIVVGLAKPAILMPHDMIDRLSMEEFDQIVLHEWAHVRRRDHWTNCAQELAKALFFFHPAVWWIGRMLDREREMACDDAVVSITGEPIPYAGCLAKLVELNSAPPVSLSPGAAGDARDLFRRVERLIHWDGGPGFSGVRFTAAAAMLLAVLVLAGAAPALVDIPAPALALQAPRPAIEAGRQALLAEERMRIANILMETADRRMASADRMIRMAAAQMRLATQIA